MKFTSMAFASLILAIANTIYAGNWNGDKWTSNWTSTEGKSITVGIQEFNELADMVQRFHNNSIESIFTHNTSAQQEERDKDEYLYWFAFKTVIDRFLETSSGLIGSGYHNLAQEIREDWQTMQEQKES